MIESRVQRVLWSRSGNRFSPGPHALRTSLSRDDAGGKRGEARRSIYRSIGDRSIDL